MKVDTVSNRPRSIQAQFKVSCGVYKLCVLLVAMKKGKV